MIDFSDKNINSIKINTIFSSYYNESLLLSSHGAAMFPVLLFYRGHLMHNFSLLTLLMTLGLLSLPPADARQDNVLRILTYNTYFDRLDEPAITLPFFINANYDLMGFQEVETLQSLDNRGRRYQRLLEQAGLGHFSALGDSAVQTPLPARFGNLMLADGTLYYDIDLQQQVISALNGITLDDGVRTLLASVIQNGVPLSEALGQLLDKPRSLVNLVNVLSALRTHQVPLANVMMNLPYAVLEHGVVDTPLLFGSPHLSSQDDSSFRLNQVQLLNAVAHATPLPIVLAGDFNAGEYAERGLFSVDAQVQLFNRYIQNPDSSPAQFYRTLLEQYAQSRKLLNALIDRGQALNDVEGAWIAALFRAENYPVDGNLPRTMNLLRQRYQLFIHDEEREPFAPHTLNDGSATWPSVMDDNARRGWGAWSRGQVDYIVVSRPFAKWFSLADDASDPYSGIMQLAFNPMDSTYRINDAYFAIDGTPMNGQRVVASDYVSASDHALVAHTLRYTGPALRLAGDGRLALIWGPEAANYTPQSPLFLLTRNNHRNDMYLGNLADVQGEPLPLLAQLPEVIKQTPLSCAWRNDAHIGAAVSRYCLDDHRMIGNVRVTGDAVLLVDDGEAMGRQPKVGLARRSTLVLATSTPDNFHLASLNHAGNLWLSAATAGNQLIVDGDYLSDDGLLGFGVNAPGADLRSDSLTLNGPSSGNIRVAITSSEGLGQQADAIALISLAGESQATFALAQRTVAAAYDYRLAEQADDGLGQGRRRYWLTNLAEDGHSTLVRPESQGYLANLAAANTLFLPRWQEMVYPHAARSAASSMWLRQNGGYRYYRDSSGQLDTRGYRYAVQLGGEVTQWQDDHGDYRLGVMGGYGTSHSMSRNRLSQRQAVASLDSYTAGVYVAYSRDPLGLQGLYFNGALQYVWGDNRVQGEQLSAQRYNSRGFLASIEGGYAWRYAINVTHTLALTPQIQLAHMGVKGKDVTEAAGTRIRDDSNGGMYARAGIRAAWQIDMASGNTLTPFAELGYQHQPAFALMMDNATVEQGTVSNTLQVSVGIRGHIDGDLGFSAQLNGQVGEQRYRDGTASLQIAYRF
ncbi:autotransporter outer membrane beta-barrel domain-containing protein [Edwardsiella anguillarum]|nr:autotransporter outer membrane beta-barrel domain-containing protein [Edwardsiella anguillarum]WHP81337.1 autotransporter outer membrane beta-barrel domain-containing protein [Edwardsiella anguillarum]WHQ25903.1 autotransporter outer membrane beta-barrel domain-containing protein [Edwardsiella anguillarum]WHQ32900.1 autotransporter outer membrane beta-barrel domain-containing protein [Edwardsiella anguillarum]